jgi:hypothetical protein
LVGMLGSSLVNKYGRHNGDDKSNTVFGRFFLIYVFIVFLAHIGCMSMPRAVKLIIWFDL